MKKLLGILILAILILTAHTGWKVWQNNVAIETISQQEINQHFLKSVAWLDENYAAIENINNPILWWMIKEAASKSNNDTLKKVFSQYKKNHLDKNPSNLSTPMFNELYRPRMPDINAFAKLDDYQVFLFYSLSCDVDAGESMRIQKQLTADFCSYHYVHPRCVTHQLMGLRFMQRYRCGYEDIVDTSINELQDVVVAELTWDYRVGDAYIQRVLMLTDTGAFDRVKPIWLKHVLSAQNDDGGWDDMDPILPLGNDYVFAHTSLLPKVGKQKTIFHATAQGIWLLSLLLESKQSF